MESWANLWDRRPNIPLELIVGFERCNWNYNFNLLVPRVSPKFCLYTTKINHSCRQIYRSPHGILWEWLEKPRGSLNHAHFLGKEWRHGFVVSAGNKTTKTRWNKPWTLEDDGNLFPQRKWYCWWFRNPARKPVEVGNVSHDLQGFLHFPGGCLRFLNHQQNFAYHCWIAVLPMSKITNQPSWLVIWWPFSLCKI